MRCLVIFLCSLLLAACSNLSSDGLFATAASTTAGVGVTALTGSPIAGATAGAAAGIGVDAFTPDVVKAASDFCTANPDECDKFLFIQFLEKVWMWAVGGVVFLMVMAWLIPGPQSLFSWRGKDARSNSTTHRSRSDWPNP